MQMMQKQRRLSDRFSGSKWRRIYHLTSRESEVSSFSPATETLSTDVLPLLTLLPCGLYIPFAVASRAFLCHRNVSCHRCYRFRVEQRNCCKGPDAVSLTASLAFALMWSSCGDAHSFMNKQAISSVLNITHHRIYLDFNKKNRSLITPD